MDKTTTRKIGYQPQKAAPATKKSAPKLPQNHANTKKKTLSGKIDRRQFNKGKRKYPDGAAHSITAPNELWNQIPFPKSPWVVAAIAEKLKNKS